MQNIKTFLLRYKISIIGVFLVVIIAFGTFGGYLYISKYYVEETNEYSRESFKEMETFKENIDMAFGTEEDKAINGDDYINGMTGAEASLASASIRTNSFKTDLRDPKIKQPGQLYNEMGLYADEVDSTLQEFKQDTKFIAENKDFFRKYYNLVSKLAKDKYQNLDAQSTLLPGLNEEARQVRAEADIIAVGPENEEFMNKHKEMLDFYINFTETILNAHNEKNAIYRDYLRRYNNVCDVLSNMKCVFEYSAASKSQSQTINDNYKARGLKQAEFNEFLSDKNKPLHEKYSERAKQIEKLEQNVKRIVRQMRKLPLV